MDPILASILASTGASALTGGLGWLGNKLFGSSDQAATPSSPMNPVGAPIQKAGNAFAGYPAQSIQFPLRTPSQQSALDQILARSVADLKGLNTSFDPIAQRARSQFNQQTLPSIAERFTAMGPGAQSSGAFRRALGSAGAGLEENLAALNAQYNLARGDQLANLLKIGLAPSFETTYMPAEPGSLSRFLGDERTQYGLSSLLEQLLARAGQSQLENMQPQAQSQQPMVYSDNLKKIQNQLSAAAPFYNPVQNTLDKIYPQQAPAGGSFAELQNRLRSGTTYNPLQNTLDRIQGVR